MRPLFLGAIVTILALGAASCASVEGMSALPLTEGQERVYADTDFEAMVDVCRDAIAKNQELVLLSDAAHRPADGQASSARAWMIVGELPGDFWTHHGSKVRVLVLEDGESGNIVRICTRRNQGINVTAPADLAPRIWPMIDGAVTSGRGRAEPGS